MSAERNDLQKLLFQYITDTLTCIHTVREFCYMSSKWKFWRETELNMLKDIKDRVEQVNLDLDHVIKSEGKGKAFLRYMKSKFTKADCRYAELESELAEVLKDTIEGLGKLNCLKDALEKLAVTSLHVFAENQMIYLPEEVSYDHVQVVIITARLICPLLLEFKNEANIFLPKRQNLDVLVYQLEKYIQTTKTICDKMEKSVSHFSLKMMEEAVVDIDEDFSENDVQRMLDHINQLENIRKDAYFRTVFMFQEESYLNFLEEFSERQPRVLEFLNRLEENAIQLDRMNKGSKISSVAGSSVGAVGGVLSIVGLALIPVTAGVSLALTMTGLGMGITSGVNSIVTTATEFGVNRTHQKKANRNFQSFMKDVQSIQSCLEKVTRRAISKIETNVMDVALGVGQVLCTAGTVARSVDAIVDSASAFKLLKTEEAISAAGKVVAQEGKALRSVPRVASEIPDVGQAAVKGSLAATKSARVGLIALNALFIGMDIFFICKDSMSLAKGNETEVSQFIRARAALWISEMDSWKKIHDSLLKGRETYGKKEVILETQFYLDA